MSWLDKFFTALAPTAATNSVQGLVTLAGDLQGNGSTAAAPLVSNMTGDVSGYANISAPNGVKFIGNPKTVEYDTPINVVTAGTSATTIFTFATTTARAYSVRGIIRVQNSPVSAYGEFEVNAFLFNNVGTLTLVGSTPVTTKANVASFILTIAAVGTNIVVTATDPVGGRRWTGRLYLVEATF